MSRNKACPHQTIAVNSFTSRRKDVPVHLENTAAKTVTAAEITEAACSGGRQRFLSRL